MANHYFVGNLSKITGSSFHHIKNVVKKKAGDFITVAYNKRLFEVCITSITNDAINIVVTREIVTKNLFNISLIQGLLKGDKSEILVKYNAMFGIKEIIFVEMERSISKLSNFDFKLKRFQSIAQSARQLSGSPNQVEISSISHISELDFKKYDIVFLCDELEKTNHLHFFDLERKEIAIIVGPEGGISDSERTLLIHKGVIPVTLGNEICSSESAGFYALAALKTLSVEKIIKKSKKY